MKKLFLFCTLIAGLTMVGCSDDDPVKSSDKQLLSFKVKETQASISESDKTVTLNFVSVVDLTALAPEISISDKASVSPASGEVKDFSSPVKYTVTAEDGTTAVYTVTITGADITTHSPSASSSSTVLTPGQSIIITAEEVEGASYSWYSEQGGLLQTTTTNTYTITEQGKYWVVITVNGTSSLASEPIVITVPFSSLKPIIASESLSLCSGGSVELRIENIEDFSTTALVFVWSKDGEEIAGASSPVYYATEAGSYNVVVKSENETSETSDEEEVIQGLAQPVIVSSHPSFCIGGSVTLSVTNSNEYPVGTSFQWYKDGVGLMAGEAGLSYAVTQEGTYNAIATFDGCNSLLSNPLNITLSNCP